MIGLRGYRTYLNGVQDCTVGETRGFEVYLLFLD